MTTRTLRGGGVADDGEFDRAFGASLTAAERMTEIWRLSEELYAIAGTAPAEPGLRRSVARVVRREDQVPGRRGVRAVRARRTARDRALERFGAAPGHLSISDLAREGTVFQIGIAPRRIDLLTSITGVKFERAWRDRVRVCFGVIEVPVIGRAALIRNKLATARPKDLVDVVELRRRRRRRGRQRS